jgi:hypothetical protein
MGKVMTPEDVRWVAAEAASQSIDYTVAMAAKRAAGVYVNHYQADITRKTEEEARDFVAQAFQEGWQAAILKLKMTVADHHNKDRRGQLVLHGTLQELMAIRAELQKTRIGVASEITAEDPHGD